MCATVARQAIQALRCPNTACVVQHPAARCTGLSVPTYVTQDYCKGPMSVQYAGHTNRECPVSLSTKGAAGAHASIPHFRPWHVHLCSRQSSHSVTQAEQLSLAFAGLRMTAETKTPLLEAVHKIAQHFQSQSKQHDYCDICNAHPLTGLAAVYCGLAPHRQRNDAVVYSA